MNGPVETLVLTGNEVERLLGAAECREAVARAFARLGEGRAPVPRSLGFDAKDGTFHVKASLFEAERPLFVAKVNGNFPSNPGVNGLPTIQGLLVLADAVDGRPLCVMDSASLTAKRTAAATAVAALHLVGPNADVVAIVGCGLQGAAHLEALLALRPFREIRLHDADAARSRALAARARGDGKTTVRASVWLRDAIDGAGIIVTCTSGAEFILSDGDVAPGAFVAAVGADNPRKREIHPGLMRRAKVVVDDLGQCAAGGDLHHALAAGVMTEADVRADLAAVVAGRAAGRVREDEIIVFDSTGIALEDAAAAEVVYRRATAEGTGARVRMGA